MTSSSSTDQLSRHKAILTGVPYVVTKQFPWKLHEMLEQAEVDGQDAIVSWMPSGRAFRVHQPELFVREIMTKHFQQSKYKSFQRQLNLWGFSRNSKETEEPGSYWHPLFVKGRKDLCQEIGRQKIKMQSGQAKEDHRAKLAALPVPELGVSASSSSNSSKSTPLTVQSTGPAALSHISEHSNQSSAAATDVLSLVSRLTRAQSPTLPVVNNTNTNNNTTGHSALSEMLALVGSQNHSNPLLKLNNTTNNNNDALFTALLLQAQLAAAPTKPLTPASFLSAPSAASTAPSTNPLLLGAMMAAAAQAQPAATASNNILAQADAEIVQAMQRKMALERLLHRCAA